MVLAFVPIARLVPSRRHLLGRKSRVLWQVLLRACSRSWQVVSHGGRLAIVFAPFALKVVRGTRRQRIRPRTVFIGPSAVPVSRLVGVVFGEIVVDLGDLERLVGAQHR
jgi:hypothetical protein